MRRFLGFALLAAALSFGPGAIPGRCQAPSAESWAASLVNQYTTLPNIVYLKANNYEDKLDVYRPNDEAAHPTLIYIHGGGWTGGSKEASAFYVLPFLLKGWAVVNVEYRLANVSRAPAAVEDCRCALRWVVQHAKENRFDTSHIVVMGNSAGGHLALTTGMLPASAGFDRQCPADEEIKVAAIVDWYGITDVNDLLDGANMKTYAVTWLGSQTDREQIARSVSPLTYVRAGLPPTIMIQGDADPTVPYAHSVRLHKALDDARVPNELVTIPGGKHGRFSASEMDMAYTHVWAFLGKYVPGISQTTQSPQQSAARVPAR
jgi:acetyl esterase/lipase